VVQTEAGQVRVRRSPALPLIRARDRFVRAIVVSTSNQNYSFIYIHTLPPFNYLTTQRRNPVLYDFKIIAE
jgi:hypothetical protein